MESLLGTTIGGYKLERAIGSGTTGQVFAAVDSVGGHAAVKVLHPNLSLFTKVQPFWEEQQKVGELAHPHIVVASSADWSKSGRFFLAADLLEGLDLGQALAEHIKLSPAQVLLFAGQACLALEALHDELHRYHGAIKPRNIFLAAKGGESWRFSTRITDFASCRLVDTSRAPSSGTGSPGVPDPAYLAPEQFNGKGGAAVDIYAMGVVLYEALSGRRPFAASSYEELAEHHGKTTPPALVNVPPALAKIVLKALAKRPADRYPGASALREALEAWASTRPAELEQAPKTLFPKEQAGPGVGPDDQEQTVRVPVEEISAVFEDDPEAAETVVTKEPSKVEDKSRTAPPKADKTEKPAAKGEAGAQNMPEDDDLAAIARRAGAALRKERPAPAQEPAAPAEPEPKEVEGYFDEDGDLVELPLERSVRAFVANISPTVPVEHQSTAGGNGESLDLALDSFVQEAKAWSSALPLPVVDDKALADLAKTPVEEPEPPPPQPERVAPQPIVVTGEEQPRPSVALPVILAFVVGGALVFGGMKLFSPKPTTTYQTEPQGEPQGEPTFAGPAVSADSASAPLAAPLADAAPTAAMTPDAAPTVAATTDAVSPTAATTLDAAAASPQPDKPAVAVKPKPRAKRVVRRRRPRVRRKPRVRRPKPKPKPKTAKPKPKPAKGGDWVDPFSQ